MATSTELVAACIELFEYHDSLHHPETSTKGETLLTDGTRISTCEDTDDQNKLLLVDVVKEGKTVSFALDLNGLRRYNDGGKTVTLESVLDPNDENRLRITYEGIDPFGTVEERFRGGAGRLVKWLRTVDRRRAFTESWTLIHGPVDTFRAARQFERFMREINPHFDINDHV